jgi:hypothetical protein
MMMRQVLCICLLLLIFTGCDKKPSFGLPASHWNTSKPITGYQWYIDGKPSTDRGDIDKSKKLILIASTSSERKIINWTLQVASGKSNVITRGRITIDPKNLPLLDWPPGGNLTIDNRKCIFRIEQQGRDGVISSIRELFVYTGSSSNTEQADSLARLQRP